MSLMSFSILTQKKTLVSTGLNKLIRKLKAFIKNFSKLKISCLFFTITM